MKARNTVWRRGKAGLFRMSRGMFRRVRLIIDEEGRVVRLERVAPKDGGHLVPALSRS